MAKGKITLVEQDGNDIRVYWEFDDLLHTTESMSFAMGTPETRICEFIALRATLLDAGYKDQKDKKKTPYDHMRNVEVSGE